MTRPPSGIYKIINLFNNKVYIGQSKNIWNRRKQHWTALYHNHHENAQMQKDWNKYSKYFRFEVVEYCDISALNDREKYWIDYYNSIEDGYNQGWSPYKRKTKKNSVKVIGYRKRS